MRNITSVQHFCVASPRQLPNTMHRLPDPPQDVFNSSQMCRKPVWLIYAPYHHIWVRYFLLVGIYITDQNTSIVHHTCTSLHSARGSSPFTAVGCVVTKTKAAELQHYPCEQGFTYSDHGEVWTSSPLPEKTPISHSNILMDTNLFETSNFYSRRSRMFLK